jgi:hypothetical protein
MVVGHDGINSITARSGDRLIGRASFDNIAARKPPLEPMPREVAAVFVIIHNQKFQTWHKSFLLLNDRPLGNSAVPRRHQPALQDERENLRFPRSYDSVS